MDAELIKRLNKLLSMANRRWLKVGQAHEYANVDEGTFSKWRKQGLIHLCVINGVKRIDREEIDQLMLDHRQ